MAAILVIGGAGFVGSYVVEAFVRLGHVVTVFDALRAPPTALFGELCAVHPLEFVRADLNDGRLLEERLTSSAFDAVVHCAGNSDTRAADRDPDADFRDGVLATRALLLAMRNSPARRIIFVSSQHVYGENQSPSEQDELRPVSAYGAAKACAEMLMRQYAATEGFHAQVARCSNIVGRGQRYGVLVDFIRKATETSSPLRVLGNGCQRRSFVHASDVARAIQRLIEVPLKPGAFEAFNVANRDAISIRDVLAIVLSTLQREAQEPLLTGPGEQGWSGDLGSVAPSIAKLLALGWQPSLSSAGAIARAVKELLT